MAFPRIFVSYAPKDTPFTQDLVDYLSNKGVDVQPDQPNIPEYEMNQELQRDQWLILVRSPNATISPRVKSQVKAAQGLVAQRRMHGILAIAAAPDDSPLWPTIRTYDAGQSTADHQKAFEKVLRTVSYRPQPGRGLNGAGTSSSQPLSALPIRPRHLGRVGLVAAVVVLLLVSSILIWNFGYSRGMGQATATATAGAKATATIVKATDIASKATANAAATVTALPGVIQTLIGKDKLQDLFNTITTIKTLLSYSFSLNMQDANQWETTNPSCKFTDQMYHASTTKKGTITLCLAHKTNFTNFAYQVDMQIKMGDAGGLIFRSSKDAKTFYRFSLDNSGIYNLSVCDTTLCTDAPTKVDAGMQLKTGKVTSCPGAKFNGSGTNTLAVIANNGTIYLYVNKIYCDQIVDQTATSGEIGVYAASVNNTTDVIFSNVKVWKLPS